MGLLHLDMLGSGSVLAALVPVFAAFLVGRIYYQRWREEQNLKHIVTHEFPDGNNSRERYISELKDLVESGYRRYNKVGQAFKVKVPIGGYSVGYRVVLPKENLDELKTRPNTVFSWAEASAVIFAGDYTGAPLRGPWSGKALRIGIHQNLASITNQLDRNIDGYFAKHLPQHPDISSSVNFMEFFIPQIASVTNALLCGEELAADPEWIRQTADFATNRYKSADDVRAWPPYIATIAAPYIPSVRRMRASREYVKTKLTPMYEELKRNDLLGGGEKAEYRKASYGFEWLWGGAPPGVTLQDFSDTMMRTLIASIHTTAKTLTIALIDMMSTAGLTEELREEAQQAMRPDGSIDIDVLTKMDCFLKESQRLTPVFILTMNRIVLKPYTFQSSGLHVPVGTMTTAATAAIATDPDTFGHDADRFDPHRFMRMRESSKGSESALKMGMATEDSLGFGFGSQACPGRFFAVNQMKLLLSKLLTQWQLTLEKNGSECHDTKPPKYEYYDFSVVPPSNYGMRLKKL